MFQCTNIVKVESNRENLFSKIAETHPILCKYIKNLLSEGQFY